MLSKAKIKSKSKGDYNSSFLHIHNDNTKKTRKVLASSIPVLSIFAFLGINVAMIALSEVFLASDKVYAETYAENSGNSSISLTIGGAGETEQVTAGRGNTTYRSHTVTLNANNIDSYVLTISGDANMTNPSGSNVVDTITSTDGYSSGNNLADNTWGYYYGDYGEMDSSKETVVYKPLVSTGTIIDSGSPTDNAIMNQTKNLIFAVKFGEDITPGRYYANANLSATATPKSITYTLSYDANGGTGTAPTTQTAITSDESYEFIIANQGDLAKAGYTFLGWAESSSATTAQYTAGGKINLNSTKPNIVLYAVWKEAGPNVEGFNGIYAMQQMTYSVCAGASIGAAGQLYDERDDSTYTVRKHEDGKCWMTQNLRIINQTITPVDSDVSNNFVIPASDIKGFSNTNGYYLSQVYYDNNITYGAYYSWTAATAGTGTVSLSSGDAPSSICPKGWKLPSRSDYAALTIAAGISNSASGSITLRNSLYKFQYAGRVDRSSLGNVGVYGRYWSRTAYSSDNAYRLYLTDSSADPNSNGGRYIGFSVRCVAYSS